MIRPIRMRYYQFLEQWKKDGLLPALKFSIYRCEEAVPVEKDLSTLGALKPPPNSEGLELVELTEEDFRSARIEYPLKSRREKALLNLQKGYRTFAMMKNHQVVGDIWCVTRATAVAKGLRQNLQWFGIELDAEEGYLFDMHVSPDIRGKAMATYFMGSVLQKMKENGFRKVYGYFDAHNIPALWVHRLLGYKELPRLTIRKILSYETAKFGP